MQPNANQAAYPRAYQEHVGKDGKMEVITCGAPGLTKREAFAKAAMLGLLSNDEEWSSQGTTEPITKRLAARAVEYADALLAALERKPS